MWDAFYLHMVALGNPVPVANCDASRGKLADEFAEHLKRQTALGKNEPGPLNYHKRQRSGAISTGTTSYLTTWSFSDG